MELSDYQRLAGRTARQDGSLERRRLVATLGLTGEAGELAELVKKQIGHGHEIPPDAMAKELGDVLWYAAAIATLYGLDLAQIAAENIAKLRQRYPEGFRSDDSIARRDVQEP